MLRTCELRYLYVVIFGMYSDCLQASLQPHDLRPSSTVQKSTSIESIVNNNKVCRLGAVDESDKKELTILLSHAVDTLLHCTYLNSRL